MKNIFLTLILSIGITFSSFSQYIVNQYYVNRGEVKTEVAYYREYNVFSNQVKPVRYCRQTKWRLQYYIGNVYYYNTVHMVWYTKFDRGYFWYCYWSKWYRC